MNKEQFLDTLIDPVGTNIKLAVAEFHKRWEVNIDVLNLIETKRPPDMCRHWQIQLFTTDSLLHKSFTDSLIYYTTKYHPTAWINSGFYHEETCMINMGILEYDRRK